MVEDTKFCKAKWTEQWIYVYVIIYVMQLADSSRLQRLYIALWQ